MTRTSTTRSAAITLLAGVVLAGAVLAGCTDNGSGSSDGAGSGDVGTVIEVISTEIGCDVSVTEAPAGPLTFEVRNDGTEVTEFYLYAEDGTTIIGEVENIGPGLTRSLDTTIDDPGSYLTACKPAMRGDGIRADFVVT